MATLLETFEAALGETVADDDRTPLAVALDELARRGRAAWPELSLSDAALARCVAERVRGAARIAEVTAALPPDDVALASACATGDAAAIGRFEDRYFPAAREALRRMGRDGGTVEDLLQRLRERLFVAPPGQVPRICALVGGGDLGALVRLSAVRLGLNAVRDDRRIDGDPQPLLEQLALDLDPETELISADARAAVRAAFTAALEALSARERTILRLHLIHGLSIDELGAAFSVHRSTAARWLAQVRGDLEEATRARLRAQWKLGEDELSSVLRRVHGQLDVSFSRVLATK
ncbi:MAG TPA: sigma-70 family RNA polymerase sigma factor [Kofleriaceae bacterium]|nr:sigma-70 family RNA polymerase sigma factor [Kofleriaceae bacterium]